MRAGNKYPNPVPRVLYIHASRMRVFGIALFPNDEVAHEFECGGGFVVGHGVACAEDVVVGETALGERKGVRLVWRFEEVVEGRGLIRGVGGGVRII